MPFHHCLIWSLEDSAALFTYLIHMTESWRGIYTTHHCQAVRSDKRESDDSVQSVCAVYIWCQVHHPRCDLHRTLGQHASEREPLHTWNNSVHHTMFEFFQYKCTITGCYSHYTPANCCNNYSIHQILTIGAASVIYEWIIITNFHQLNSLIQLSFLCNFISVLTEKLSCICCLSFATFNFVLVT